MIGTDLDLGRWTWRNIDGRTFNLFFITARLSCLSPETLRASNSRFRGRFDDGSFWIDISGTGGRREGPSRLENGHLTSEQRDVMIKCLCSIRTGEMEPHYIMWYGFYEGIRTGAPIRWPSPSFSACGAWRSSKSPSLASCTSADKAFFQGALIMKKTDRILLLIAGLISCLNAGILPGERLPEVRPAPAIPAILAAVGGIIWLWLSFSSGKMGTLHGYASRGGRIPE